MGSGGRSHGDTVRCLLLPKHVCARIYISTLDLNLFPRAFNPGRLWRTSVRLPYSQWVRSKEVHAYIQTLFFGLEIDPGS